MKVLNVMYLGFDILIIFVIIFVVYVNSIYVIKRVVYLNLYFFRCRWNWYVFFFMSIYKLFLMYLFDV